MYMAVTHQVKVTVEPAFDPDRSDPDEGRYFWRYDVEIANLGDRPVTLMDRYWRITDADGRQQEVRGAAQSLARMSPDRQVVMRHAFQQLRGMPPGERQRMLNSGYGAQFSPQERTVLGNMLSIEPYQQRIIQPYFGR